MNFSLAILLALFLPGEARAAKTYPVVDTGQAQALPAKLNAANFGGFKDWRLPSIKKL